MIQPPFRQLPETTLSKVLQFVGQLRQASKLIADNQGGAHGRLSDKATATRHWSGPHRETFESLFADETDAAHITERALADEADAWAKFWASNR